MTDGQVRQIINGLIKVFESIDGIEDSLTALEDLTDAELLRIVGQEKFDKLKAFLKKRFGN